MCTAVFYCNSLFFLFFFLNTFFNIPFLGFEQGIMVHLVLLQAKAMVRVELLWVLTACSSCIGHKVALMYILKDCLVTVLSSQYSLCVCVCFFFIRCSSSCYTFLLSFGAQRRFIHDQTFAGVFLI